MSKQDMYDQSYDSGVCVLIDTKLFAGKYHGS